MSITTLASVIETGADWLLKVPNAAQDQSILVAPGGAGTARAYTLIYDVYIPAATAGGWVPFFQTDVTNTSDGDLFGKIADGEIGLGISGDYKGAAKLDAWNRLAFTVETKDGVVTITKYVNGVLAGTQTSADTARYAIDKAKGFLIFSDEDGETSPVHLTNFAYVEKAMSASEIAALGGVNAEGILVGAQAVEAARANGSEFRFAQTGSAPAFGQATLTPNNITLPATTADKAEIPAAPEPDQILSIAATQPNQTVRLAPGGTGQATSYSIAFDIYVSAASATKGWIPFFQSDLANASDGDLFGKVWGDHYGVGIGGDFPGQAKLDAWNRIVFTVEIKNGAVTIGKYVNGVLVGTQTSSETERYSFDKAKGFLIFSDEDGETSGVHVSNIAYVEAALTEAQIKLLGGPNAAGIVPDALKPAFLAANGSEFRFDGGKLTATVGAGKIVSQGAEAVVHSAADAGVPAVTAPVAEAPAVPPTQLRSIKDMLLKQGADKVVIDLDAHFKAAGLTFTVTSSDGKVIEAKLVGHKLELDIHGLGRSDIHISAVDAAGKVYTDDFRVRVAGPHAYTFAVIPDTHVTSNQAAMMQWLADHAKDLNLRFVTHVGDATNNNLPWEWDLFNQAMSKLNGIVPYAVLPGNHDQAENAKSYASLLSQYFSVDYLKRNSTLGGVYDQEPNETKNAWYTFTGADGTKWIVLSLEFGARDDVLRWAGEVLDAHADYRAIVTTHHYTNMATRADNYSGPLFEEGTGKDYGTGNSAENANDGEDMWQKLISKHTNVKFVFSGHVFGDGAETVVSYNDAGEPVYQMLVNYQDGVSLEVTGNGDASQGGNGGNGAIRLITIDPDNGKVYTETYLEARDEYVTGSRGDPEPSRDGKGATPRHGAQHPIQPISFATETVAGAPSGVITAPRFDPFNGLKVKPGFAPAGGGEAYAAYTMIYDVKLPREGGLASIFQSDLNNISDGDLWLNFRAGHAVIGTNGQDEGHLPLDKWIRIVLTLERTGAGFTLKKYVDGVLQGSQLVGSNFSITANGFLIFADDGYETTSFSLSSFAFVEKALSAAEVAALGGASASGPYKAAPAGVNMVQFDFSDGTLKPTIGSGSISQTIGSGNAQQPLTGALREQQETFHDKVAAPKVQFVAHAGDDQTVSAGTAETATIHLDAGKTVDKLGQIVRYEWLNADGEVIATTARADVALGAGVHHLTLRAIGSTGTTSSDEVTVAVKDSRTLLHETFDDGNADGWTAPGARWQVAGTVASRSLPSAGLPAKEGALRAFDDASGIMRWAGAGSEAWSGYTVSATLTAEDQKAFGLVAYYKDAQNYYRLTFDIARNERLLVKVQDGVETVLARETATSPFDRAFLVKLAVENGKLLATVDGEAMFGGVVSDKAPLSGGTVGVYSEGQRQVFFDDIFVQKGTLIADAGHSLRVVDTDGDGVAWVDLSALASAGIDAATQVAWSENGKALAAGSQAKIALAPGAHLIRLDLAGAAGKASDTVRIEVVAAKDLLLHEDFSDGQAQGFRFVDEGELGSAAAWSVRDGALVQSADRYSRELGGSGATAPASQWNLYWSPLGDGVHALRKGAYALYEGAGAAEWTNYSVETHFTAKSGGGVGLMLHYKDAKNYYKFELDNTTGLPQLFSLKDGIEQTLWQGPQRYDINGKNHLRADIVDGRLQIWLNGTALFTQAIEIHDTEKGTFGLYNWHAGLGVSYDDVRVIALASSKQASSLLGTSGDDVLSGGDGHETLVGLGGDDTLVGNGGSDRLDGGAGSDTLLGGAGDDTLDGGAGKDLLDGGAGNDTLSGGTGSDTYVYSRGEGSDLIAEAVDAEGRDVLVLKNLARSQVTLQKHGADVEALMADGSKITLRNQLALGGIELLVFADGVQLGRDAIAAGLVNRGPQAVSDLLEAVDEDSLALLIPFSKLVGNDLDADLDNLTVTGVSDAVGGVVELTAEGVRFTPAANFTGEASFSYTLSDGRGGTVQAKASFTVKPVNDAPVAAAVSVATDEDVAVTGTVVARDADGDSLAFAVKANGGPAHGRVSLDAATGAFTYTPSADAHGGDSFTVVVSDGHGGTVESVVSVAVKPVNDAPVAMADSVSLDERDRRVFDLLANDRDVDGDALSLTGVAVTKVDGFALDPAAAQAAFAIVDGKLSVDPGTVFAGLQTGESAVVTLSYTVSDGHGGTAQASVTVTIAGYTPYRLVAGSDAPETLTGADGRDLVEAGGGDDVVLTGAGDDMVHAGLGDDRVLAGSGDDMVDGGAGDDTLAGGSGKDALLGGAGNDLLSGGSGDDHLTGGAGNDVLQGGSGADTFHFAAQEGRDTVLEFKPAAADATEHDVIELSKALFADYAALIAAHALSDGAEGAVLDLGGGNTVTFVGVKAETLAIDDFKFA
ncbi:MAG: Ig-like domain-containing protein [Bosea sp. (in: a-proteobacteria)]